MFSFLVWGVTSRVARSFGAGDHLGAARTGMQAFWLALLCGSAAALVGVVFAGPIVDAFGADPQVRAFAEPYLRIRAISAVSVLVAQVGHGWLRGVHDTRTPMYITVVAFGLNAILDYILIFVAGWGVEGAAWSTVIGQGAAAVAFLYVLVPRFRIAPWRIDPRVMRSLLKIGVELVVRTGALLAAITYATAMAARMGTVPLAAWQITNQVFLLLALSLDALAVAAQALIARYLGATDLDRARAVGLRVMWWGTVVGVALLVVVGGLRGITADVFSDDPRVIAMASDLLGWLAAVQPLAAVAFMLDGILVGAEDTRFMAAAMIGSSALYAAGATVALAADWGVAGLAGAATLWLIARTATTWIRFRGARWYETRFA